MENFTSVEGVMMDISGDLRIVELQKGLYVVGEQMLIPVESRQQGREEIRKLKELEY
ncbi:MAG: hypothetical protein ACLFVT_03360 [Syntrophobacteria bacterium]